MRKLLIAAAMLPQLVCAQRVYVTDKRNDADVLVYRTKYFCEAHLTIKRTFDYSLPEKHHWFFVDSKQAADPGWVIYYVDDRKQADTCVYFTDRIGLLGSHIPVKTPVEPEWLVKENSKRRRRQ